MHRLIISLFVAAVYLSVMAVPIFAASQQVATARAPQPERIMFHSEYGTAEMISGDFVIKAPGTRLDKTLVFFRSRPEAFRMALRWKAKPVLYRVRRQARIRPISRFAFRTTAHRR